MVAAYCDGIMACVMHGIVVHNQYLQSQDCYRWYTLKLWKALLVGSKERLLKAFPE